MFKKIALVIVVWSPRFSSMPRPGLTPMHVERAARIKAPPEKIFLLINDFHRGSSGHHTRSATPR